MLFRSEVEADADGVAVAEGVLAPHPAKLPNNMNMTRAKLSILKTDFLMVLPPLIISRFLRFSLFFAVIHSLKLKLSLWITRIS